MKGPVSSAPNEPERIGGHPVWRASAGDVEVRFVGRGADGSREEILGRVEPAPPAVAALRQVHSAHAVPAAGPGFHGEGDALLTGRRGLALSVITADCVPVLLAVGESLVAIHAGWRGAAAGVVFAALAGFSRTELAEARAWVGPAIGPCCYEVDADVAARVAAAAKEASVVSEGPRGKPHLDVRGAVVAQLGAAGVGSVEVFGPCTRCHPELLWSYRREGKGAGRNIAYVWRGAT